MIGHPLVLNRYFVWGLRNSEVRIQIMLDRTNWQETFFHLCDPRTPRFKLNTQIFKRMTDVFGHCSGNPLDSGSPQCWSKIISLRHSLSLNKKQFHLIIIRTHVVFAILYYRKVRLPPVASFGYAKAEAASDGLLLLWMNPSVILFKPSLIVNGACTWFMVSLVSLINLVETPKSSIAVIF